MAPQVTPRGWIFGTMIFYNLKNSGQDLSNEGSNEKLAIEFLKHSCFLANYLKLQIWPISEYGKILNLLSFDLGH